MTGLEHGAIMERSYSPVYKARGLREDDPLEVYAERVAEMGLEMDMAMEYMDDVGKFLGEKKDLVLLGDCEKMAEDVIDQHMDIMDEMNEQFLRENLEADDQMQELLEMQRALGYEIEEPQFSIEGQKLLEKEKRKRKKAASIYEIAEDEKEGESDAGESEDDGFDDGDNEGALIPYMPILTRPLEEMNHAEAQEEVGDSLMLMFDHIRQ